MWIVIGLSIAVAVIATWFWAMPIWRALPGSSRYHRWEHERQGRTGRMMRPRHVRTGCTLCAATFEADRPVDAVNEKNAHVLRSHAQSGSEAVHPTTGPAVRRGA